MGDVKPGWHMTDQQVGAEPAQQPHVTTCEPKGKFVKDNM